MKTSRRRFRFTKAQVLAWADAWRRRTGRYPTQRSGAIQPGARLTWKAVELSLRHGGHGLPGGSSLAQLLAERRGVRNQARLPRLSEALILHWADDHFRRTGRWPQRRSGPIQGVAGETWAQVEDALLRGLRGLDGGSSVARLLDKYGRKPNRSALPRLTMEEILSWAEAAAGQTGSWPTADSGPVPGAPGETWSRLDAALRQGHRGLPGGASLAGLVRLYRNLKLESACGNPLWDGNRIFKGTAAQLAARVLGGTH
jgi:hypothetical protein